MAQAIKSLFTFLMHVGEAQNVTLDMQQLYLRLSHSMQYESMAEVRKHLSNFSLVGSNDRYQINDDVSFYELPSLKKLKLAISIFESFFAAINPSREPLTFSRVDEMRNYDVSSEYLALFGSMCKQITKTYNSLSVLVKLFGVRQYDTRRSRNCTSTAAKLSNVLYGHSILSENSI